MKRRPNFELLCASLNGKWLLAVSRAGKKTVFQRLNGKTGAFDVEDSIPSTFGDVWAISPNGQLIVAGGWTSGQVSLFNVEQRSFTETTQFRGLTLLAFGDDDTLHVAANNKMYSGLAGLGYSELRVPTSGEIERIVGNLMVVAQKRLVQVRDLVSQNVIAEFQDSGFGTNDVYWDGSILLIASARGHVLQIYPQTQSEARVLKSPSGHHPIRCAFDRQEQVIVVLFASLQTGSSSKIIKYSTTGEIVMEANFDLCPSVSVYFEAFHGFVTGSRKLLTVSRDSGNVLENAF